MKSLNSSPDPSVVGAGRSVVAVHVTNRRRLRFLGVIASMSDTVRSILLVSVAFGLCSCAYTVPKAVAKDDDKPFVYVAAVHDVPFDDEPKPDAWHYAHSVLDAAGIRYFMEEDLGVTSISVEPSRCHDAVVLLSGDAKARGYWIEIAKRYR
jgi:hypothetical protein